MGMRLLVLALLVASAILTICLCSGDALAAPLQCSVKTSCEIGETDVLHMSATSNAHAELPAQNNYQNKICCSGPVPLGNDCGAADATAFLNLFSPANSHVEEATLSNYANKACISGMDIECAYMSDCRYIGPAGDVTCLASISGDTNAHVGSCTGSFSYPTKVCCSKITHPLVNFLAHMLIASLGTTIDTPMHVRNLGSTTQNVTIGLEGYDIASLQPADGLTLLGPPCRPGRCANITLSPREQRTLYLKIATNDVTGAPVNLNVTAVSSLGVKDNDTMSIIVMYPADFPAFDAWWAVLLMMMFAGIVFYRTEASV